MIEVGDDLAASAQDIVVDIEATSRFGVPTDRVTITTTATVDGRLVRLTEQRDVDPEDGDPDTFRLTLGIPVRGTSLEGRWSALVLLPRSTPVWEVSVEATTDDGTSQVLSPDTEYPRRVIACFGEHSALDIVWSFVRGRG